MRISRKNNEVKKVQSVKRMIESNRSLLYDLKYTHEKLDGLINENYLNKDSNKLVCIHFKEPIIKNISDIVKVTNSFYGFKENRIILDFDIEFIYSDGSILNKKYDFEFIEYGGHKAKDINILINKYAFDSSKFKSKNGYLFNYERMEFRALHLDDSLKLIRRSLMNNKHLNCLYLFNNSEMVSLFVKGLKENKESIYISLLKENSSLINSYINKSSSDDKAKTRLISLFNRFENIFDFYKSIDFHPDENYKMFSFYKLELGIDKGFIYTNGLSCYYVTYNGSGLKVSCLYDLYKGSKVSDCIKVLESFTRHDKSGMLELFRMNFDLRKKEFDKFSKFKREWDYKINRG